MTDAAPPNPFDPFPTLTTPRLRLREMSLDDAEDLFRIRSNPEVVKYWGAPPDAKVDETTARLVVVRDAVRAGTGIRWAITDRETGAFLGSGGIWRWDKRHFRGEIGYELSPDHWGKGLMAEAIRAFVRFGFEGMNLHSIEANVDPRNKASVGVLLKVGFKQEGLLRENFFYDGEFSDTAVFSLLRS